MRSIRNLEVHVAHGCNFRCESCAHYSNQGHQGMLTLDEAAEWMAPWNGRISPNVVSLLGGEPTIHPRLAEILMLTREHWPAAHLQLVTNGSFLHRHPGLPQVLQEDPNASVCLSVHHDSPEYAEKLRPVLALLNQWVGEYGIRVLRRDSFKHWTRRYKGIGAAMEPYDDRQPRRSWEQCPAKYAAQLFEGKIWKCGPLAYLKLQDAKYRLSEHWRPYLQYRPLDPGCTDAELDAFFEREEESSCGMCPANPERFVLPLPVAVAASSPSSPASCHERELTAATTQAVSSGAAAGSARSSETRIASASPLPAKERARPVLRCRVRQFEFPLAENRQSGWRPYPIFGGATRQVLDLSCHVSVLSPGTTPHRPHRHIEEEILIMLAGEADLLIFNRRPPWNPVKHRLRAGEFIYYPANQPHTIYCPGPENATYLMFKWRGERAGAESSFREKRIVRFRGLPPGAGKGGFQTRCVLEGRTQHLRKLHCHVTTLQPGCGYRPHADPYDVAIIVLEGTVRTLDRQVGPHGVVFCAAGEPHGMRNVGVGPAVYLVFEFHGGHEVLAPKGEGGGRKSLAAVG